MKDMTVSKALKWIFIAEILCILAFIPLVGAVLALIGFILNLVALYGASKLEQGYHTALILTVVGIVLSVLGLFAKGVFGSIVSIVSTVVSLGVLYFVITTTCKLLEAQGANDVAAKGAKVWKINLICAIAAVVLMLLAFVPVLAAILAVVIAIVEIVAGILYLIFLYKSYNTL